MFWCADENAEKKKNKKKLESLFNSETKCVRLKEDRITH